MNFFFKKFLHSGKDFNGDIKAIEKSQSEEIKNATLERRKVLEVAYVRRRVILLKSWGICNE